MQVSQSDVVCHCLTTWMELIYLHREFERIKSTFSWGHMGSLCFSQKNKKNHRDGSLRECHLPSETWLFLCSHRTRFACDLKAPCEISKVLKHVSAIFHGLWLILYVEEQYLLWQWSESNQIKAVRHIINIVVALLQLVDPVALCAQSNPQCQLTKEQKYNTPQTSPNANHVNTCLPYTRWDGMIGLIGQIQTTTVITKLYTSCQPQ